MDAVLVIKTSICPACCCLFLMESGSCHSDQNSLVQKSCISAAYKEHTRKPKIWQHGIDAKLIVVHKPTMLITICLLTCSANYCIFCKCVVISVGNVGFSWACRLWVIYYLMLKKNVTTRGSVHVHVTACVSVNILLECEWDSFEIIMGKIFTGVVLFYIITRSIKRVLSLPSLTPLLCHLCRPGFLIGMKNKSVLLWVCLVCLIPKMHMARTLNFFSPYCWGLNVHKDHLWSNKDLSLIHISEPTRPP